MGYQSWGEIVRDMREERQLSQPELAEMAGVEVGVLRAIEAGGGVSRDVLERLMTALDVELCQ